MTNSSAKQKRKKRREKQLAEEERSAHGSPDTHSVSTQPIIDPTLDDTAVPPIHSVRVVPSPTIPPCIPQPAAPREARTPPPPRLPRFPVQFLPYQIDPGPLPMPPSRWPDHVGAFVYGPNQSWADDIPQPAPSVVMSISHASRNWATLRSVSTHPWRAIRRRKRRLRAECSWERPTYGFEAPPPVVPLPPLPLEDRPRGLSLRPADLLDLVPLHPDDPFHPNDVPPNDLPPSTLCLFPDDHPPSQFPVNTEYGPLVHELAHACSRTLPTALGLDIVNNLCDMVWPPLAYPDGSSDISSEARPDLLARLPPDHLVFLLAITQMGRLEHHFALLFNDAITEFARLWVHHCELVGEAG
ncbi:hypothetical protein K438DRAFT_1836124 [Mycena galopus ATCC 62051]|nr:hypothetical protein K438DRAFT_1836124 [Mycena galopus ATCC 62051]